MPDLTQAYKAEFDALRLVYLGEEAEAQLIRYAESGNYTNIGVPLTESWNASRSKLVSGKNTQLFDYADVDAEREDDLRKATGVIIRINQTKAGRIFKLSDKDEPIGLTQTWSMVMIPTGEYEEA